MSVKSQDDIPLADADDADAIVDDENTNNMRTGTTLMSPRLYVNDF